MDVDLACALGLVAMPVAAGACYAVRVAVRGPATSERVAREERDGRSALLAKGVMEMFHWVLAPIGAACLRLGISANAVTFGSLVLGLAAAVALATGHFGAGGLLAALGAAGDALDGVVARASNRASDAGEVFDAAVDRYTEMALLGGIAVYMRHMLPLLVLALLAIAGSFMISYSTAKAEALHVTPPRGSMRRSERAVCLVLGAALVPFAALGGARFHDVPLASALLLIAVVGNVSAMRRLHAIARAVSEPPPRVATAPATADDVAAAVTEEGAQLR
jgi:CDP-diacylglycerol--glycerol-3-phosphate 3-phosphatidyltransferase